MCNRYLQCKLKFNFSIRGTENDNNIIRLYVLLHFRLVPVFFQNATSVSTRKIFDEKNGDSRENRIKQLQQLNQHIFESQAQRMKIFLNTVWCRAPKNSTTVYTAPSHTCYGIHREKTREFHHIVLCKAPKNSAPAIPNSHTRVLHRYSFWQNSPTHGNFPPYCLVQGAKE